MVKPMRHFQKISGYKVISKCRNCGKRIVGKSETYYCEDCLAKLRSYREREAKRIEDEKAAARAAVEKRAAAKKALAERKAAARRTAKPAAKRPVAKKRVPAKRNVKKAAAKKRK